MENILEPMLILVAVNIWWIIPLLSKINLSSIFIKTKSNAVYCSDKECICANCKYNKMSCDTDATLFSTAMFSYYCKKHKIGLSYEDVSIRHSCCNSWKPSYEYIKEIRNIQNRKKYLLFKNEEER